MVSGSTKSLDTFLLNAMLIIVAPVTNALRTARRRARRRKFVVKSCPYSPHAMKASDAGEYRIWARFLAGSIR